MRGSDEGTFECLVLMTALGLLASVSTWLFVSGVVILLALWLAT